MKAVRKQFESPSQFPFYLVFKDTKSPQSELPDHLHDWYEIVYVYEGRGTFFIDQTFHDMSSGDVFIIPGNTIHRAIPDQEIPVTSSAIFFSPLLIQNISLSYSVSYLRLFEDAKRNKIYKYSVKKNDCFTLEHYINEMKNEEIETEPDHEHAIVLNLHLLLLFLKRHCLLSDTSKNIESHYGPAWMKSVLLFIDEHLCEPLDLELLSNKAAVSSAHFSRIFKQLIGMNLIDYITTKRIILAKELLHQSNDTIQTVANQSGFQSLPHFYRTFKKHTGMTPKEYRK